MTELTINEIVKDAHETAKAKGWWDTPRTGLEIMALIHSEVSEAIEAIRDGITYADFEAKSCGAILAEVCDKTKNCKDCPANNPIKKPIGLPSELADIIIRIADYCGHEGIDLDSAIKAKMAYNKTRPYRHGGKQA